MLLFCGHALDAVYRVRYNAATMSGGSSQILSLKVVDADETTTPKKASASKTKTAKKAVRKTTAKTTKVTSKTKKKAATKTNATAKTTPKKKPAKKTTTKNRIVKRSSTKTAKKVPKKATTKASAKNSATKSRARIKKTESTKRTPIGTTPKLNSNASFDTLKRDPLGHLLVEKKLRDAGFTGTISSDARILDAYATDESIFSIRPQVVLQPDNTKDIETAVRVIGAETEIFPSLSLTPRAAGTGLSGGSLTDSAVIDVSINLTNINEPKTKKGITTITCEPGAMFRDVEKVLKHYNVYLPAAPASKDICTIGGAVANNAAGADSLKYGHMANWVESLDVVLYDGKTYKIEPLTYKQFKALVKKNTAYAEIARRVFNLIEKNETIINDAKPATRKNTAGFPLWNVLSYSSAEFKKGNGTFDLTQLISGSQGTIGIVTSLTLRTAPIVKDKTLIVLPIFDLESAGRAILQALEYDPINVEIFDDISFDLALQNPQFFKDRIKGLAYYRVMYTLYTTYHVTFRRKIPRFTMLITLDNSVFEKRSKKEVVSAFRETGCKVVRLVKSDDEAQMWWQVRRASYSLSKLQDETKRPAAFLEDMTVPPGNLLGFFNDIQRLFKKFDIHAAVHGHGGNGHFHFYPLLDFNNSKTPDLIEKMSEAFFDCAIKHGGSICGEHNDGIIRSPHLSKMYNKSTLKLFAAAEHIFDPLDIFNPGKKVNPRFDIKDSIRKSN